MKFRSFLATSAVGAAVITLLPACAEDTTQPSRAIVEATLQRGGAATNCPATGSWLEIGNFTRPDKPETAPVQDGQTQESKAVKVVCAVTASGTQFTFASEASLQGEGSVNISGTVNKTGESKVRAFFNRSDVGRFTQDDCVFTPYHPGGEYETKDGKQPDIAPGRIWGKIVCGAATRSDTDPPRVCLANVDFRFENCSQ
jgi:hypothetical protein